MTTPHVNTSGGMERASVLSLRNALEQAIRKGVALAHFNVADLAILKGVFAAAQDLKVPVIIGVSEDERKFVGVRQISALVRSLREEFDFPIFLNADHTHSLASAVDVATAGFDAIVFDLSALPMEENIRQTKAAVEVLKGINPAILIEGEIGDIGTGSGIHDASPELKRMTTPEEAKHFADATGVDILAPAVGNMHGMVQSMVEGTTKKHLDITRIAQIKRAAGAWITLHGASGTDDNDLRKAIAAGINIIHINTELRVAWRRGLDKSLAEHPQEVVPYKILPAAVEAVKRAATDRLKLFNNLT
ncbi:MAG TPA: class II fructose-bisphosphate aldolase [Candidatus Angelobacter sp.]|jgi:ketose-bisphosphate aldolase|nr:class II fructose-bisphosphate aldolase [Candidatus Angelobacter sp.]